MKFVNNAMIYSDVQGSDHCPIGVEVDSGVFG
jgi:exonuclease III